MCNTVVTTAEEVLAVLADRRWSPLAIDGNDGAGKSTLARRLGSIAGASVVHVDEFLEKDRGTYLDALRYEDLAETLEALERVIVEGVCVLDVFARFEREADALVYVRRTHRGRWPDERDLDVTDDLDAHLAQREADVRRLVATRRGNTAAKEFSFGGLRREIIAYHYRYRPWESADAVFEREDAH